MVYVSQMYGSNIRLYIGVNIREWHHLNIVNGNFFDIRKYAMSYVQMGMKKNVFKC